MTTENQESKGACNEPELSDSLRTFGAVLKALREEAGLTQEAFAPKVRYSAPYVAKIEQGKRFPPFDLVPRAESVLGDRAGRVLRAAARTLRRKAGLVREFHQWAAIEEHALSLSAYECRVVPGLLQPASYMRSIFEMRMPPEPEEQIQRQVEARSERQRLLIDKPDTTFSFIIEQAVLERCVGGTETTRELLDHLIVQADRRNVEIQVMPLRQENHSGLDGVIYLAETQDHSWIGYSEGQEQNVLITAQKEVSALMLRYGRLRTEALNREATLELLTKMRGAL